MGAPTLPAAARALDVVVRRASGRSHHHGAAMRRKR